jgi:hypothetical protein
MRTTARHRTDEESNQSEPPGMQASSVQRSPSPLLPAKRVQQLHGAIITLYAMFDQALAGINSAWSLIGSPDLIASESRDGAVGALRAEGIEAARITVAAPDGFNGEGESEEHHEVDRWLIEHLLRHGHSEEQAQSYERRGAAGDWLVRVMIRMEEEDRSVRNLLVTAGAKEISGLTDGTMIPINLQAGAGTGKW